ncbi:hypothetical protein PR048_027100 [Dryococelus australis]|uniref:Uncharacterized protein n=1 Tax=Dryococelus australis TaxID=614101 RepID=A0ABQ9GEH1_9NEOP|nr:hypothetical protein PR048_027100 [Dryococelus australis]
MERHRHERAGQTGDPRVNPSTRRHHLARFPIWGNPGATRRAIEFRALDNVGLHSSKKAKSKYRNRIRLERASQKQSSDTYKTPYDRVKRCRERNINIKASERINGDIDLEALLRLTTKMNCECEGLALTTAAMEPQPALSLTGCHQCLFFDRVFTYAQNARRHERMACKKNPLRAMKHYYIGPTQFVQAGTLKEHTRDLQGFVYRESAKYRTRGEDDHRESIDENEYEESDGREEDDGDFLDGSNELREAKTFSLPPSGLHCRRIPSPGLVCERADMSMARENEGEKKGRRGVGRWKNLTSLPITYFRLIKSNARQETGPSALLHRHTCDTAKMKLLVITRIVVGRLRTKWEGHGGLAARLLTSHQGETGSIPGRVTPGFSTVKSCRTTSLPGLCHRHYWQLFSYSSARAYPRISSPPSKHSDGLTKPQERLSAPNWAPVHNVCSVVVTPLESRRATSCGYNSSHPVWHALYECLQDIHGDSSPFLLQPFHELSNGFWPCLTWRYIKSFTPYAKDETDRSRWQRTTNLRAPPLNCFSANTSSENGMKTNKRSTSSSVYGSHSLMQLPRLEAPLDAGVVTDHFPAPASLEASIHFHPIGRIAVILTPAPLLQTMNEDQLLTEYFPWGRDGIVVRLLASYLDEPCSIPGEAAPEFSHVGIVQDDAAGWWVFSGLFRFPTLSFRRSSIPHLASPSSALKTSMIRTAQISSLTRKSKNGRHRKYLWRKRIDARYSVVRGIVRLRTGRIASPAHGARRPTRVQRPTPNASAQSVAMKH